MPFKSKKQAAYLFAKKPAVAKEFAAKTPSIKSLPTRVGKKAESKILPNPTKSKIGLAKRGLI